MLRLVELALFLSPFAAFIAWQLMARQSSPPLRLVVGAACVLVVLAGLLVWLSQEAALPPGTSYAPARFQGGRIIPGHGAPQ